MGVTQNRVGIDLHEGSVLMKLAGMYPTVQQVVEENIQNSLDSEASVIEVRINQNTGSIGVYDNGKGISEQRFHTEISKSVGQTLKKRGKLGQFGIGLISPLGKCEKFRVVSSPGPGQPFLEWVMVTQDIAKQKEVDISQRDRPELVYTPKNGQTQGKRVWWRTATIMSNVTRDKTVSKMTLKSLSHGILDKYSTAMKRLSAVVNITFIDNDGNEQSAKLTPKTYYGRKLPLVEYVQPDCGDVQCELYVTDPKRRKRINIYFRRKGDDFRVAWPIMMSSSVADIMPEEVKDAFRTGLFEGEFVAEKITLNPQRTFFEKDDALIGLVVVMETWLKDHGSRYLDNVRRERSENRYQDLGRKSMDRLMKFFQTNDGSSLLSAAKEQFKIGNIGKGHTRPDNIKSRGLEEKKSLTEMRKQSGGGDNESRRKKGADKPKERPGHTPTSVAGPKGIHRTSVKNNSIGFHFDFDEIEGSDSLWELDMETGTLIFNITHPIWVECDEKDWMVCSLMETVAMQALTLATMSDPDHYFLVRLQFDRFLEGHIGWMKTNVSSLRLK